MNSIVKKIVFVIAFVLVALVLPLFIMFMFVDTTSKFSTYLIVYGVILFSIFGYIIVSVRSMEKKLEDALEEIKMQNAAIAYKISNTGVDLDLEETVEETEVEEESTARVTLNPAEPLVAPEVKKVKKVVDDNFDDFK